MGVSITKDQIDNVQESRSAQKPFSEMERRLGRKTAALFESAGIAFENVSNHHLQHKDIRRLEQLAEASGVDANATLTALTLAKNANSEIPAEVMNAIVLSHPKQWEEKMNDARSLSERHDGLSVPDAILLFLKAKDPEALLKEAEESSAFKSLPVQDHPRLYGILGKQYWEPVNTKKVEGQPEWKTIFARLEKLCKSPESEERAKYEPLLAMLSAHESLSWNDRYFFQKSDFSETIPKFEEKSREFPKWGVTNVKMVYLRHPKDAEGRLEIANRIEERNPELTPSAAIQTVTFCNGTPEQLERAGDIVGELTRAPVDGVRNWTQKIAVAAAIVTGKTREEAVAALLKTVADEKKKKQDERAERTRKKEEEREQQKVQEEMERAGKKEQAAAQKEHVSSSPAPTTQETPAAPQNASQVDMFDEARRVVGGSLAGLGNGMNISAKAIADLAGDVGAALIRFRNAIYNEGRPAQAAPQSQKEQPVNEEPAAPGTVAQEPLKPKSWTCVPETEDPAWFKKTSDSERGRALAQAADALANELGGFGEPWQLKGKIDSKLRELGLPDNAIAAMTDELRGPGGSMSEEETRDRLMPLLKCAVFLNAVGKERVEAFASVLGQARVERTQADGAKVMVPPVARLLSDDVLENHPFAARLQAGAVEAWLRARAITGSEDVTGEAVRGFINEKRRKDRHNAFSCEISGRDDPFSGAFFDYISEHPDALQKFAKMKLFNHPDGVGRRVRERLKEMGYSNVPSADETVCYSVAYYMFEKIHADGKWAKGWGAHWETRRKKLKEAAAGRTDETALAGDESERP